MKYKKGDWVIFKDYSDYPVQLDQPEKMGFVRKYCGGNIFSEMSESEAKKSNIKVEYYIRDPRNFLQMSYGYVSHDSVRLATKKDFNYPIKIAKIRLSMAEKEFRAYIKAREKLKI